MCSSPLKNPHSQQAGRTRSIAFQPQTRLRLRPGTPQAAVLTKDTIIEQAGEAPSEPERAAHEAEIWPKGQAEPRITLPGRDHMSSQEAEGFALWFGEPGCSAPKARPLSRLPANAEPHRDTEPHPRPQKEIKTLRSHSLPSLCHPPASAAHHSGREQTQLWELSRLAVMKDSTALMSGVFSYVSIVS